MSFNATLAPLTSVTAPFPGGWFLRKRSFAFSAGLGVKNGAMPSAKQEISTAAQSPKAMPRQNAR
jgi:hypothetical protein